jgi:bile acid:Na+ symporter, BASS family
MLALMMLTMGLTLTTNDFVRVFKVPTAALTGAFCQLLLLPAIGWLVIVLFKLEGDMALGLMLICLCPGGVLSNYVSFAARGDVALSVSLTVLSSFITVFSVPILLRIAQSALGANETEVTLPVWDTMQFMASITVIPVALGMLVNSRFVELAQRIAPKLSTICSVMLGIYIVYVWSNNAGNIAQGAAQIGAAVSVLILLSSLLAAGIALVVKLSPQRVITLVIETGLQNSALAFTLAVVILKNESLAIPNVFYSVAMFAPALLMVWLGRRLIGSSGAP